MRGPNGFFVLASDHTTTPQIMIAGGIGITPYRSIIKYVADKNLPVPIHLLHSDSTPEEIAFKDELDKITEEHKNIRVVRTITKPEESKVKWTGPTGRIDKSLIQTVVRQPKSDNRQPVFWLCGPPAMVSGMEAVFAQMKVPPHRLKTEKFTGY